MLAIAITAWIAALSAIAVLFCQSRRYALLSRNDWTGLLTKTAWQHAAEAELARASRTHAPPTVALLDIDHFKQINDTFGHLAGDQVLSSLATAIQAQLRPYDLAGRFGGDEIALLFPDTTIRQAERIVDRIHAAITAAGVVTVTISVGISGGGDAAEGLETLLAAADVALYEAKRAGRNRPGPPAMHGCGNDVCLQRPAGRHNRHPDTLAAADHHLQRDTSRVLRMAALHQAPLGSDGAR
jgi:diguanylate cyclase (GGDEF)-like protein